MASLQAVLKIALQVHYEVEENELAAEPLPDRDERRIILLYEAAEGGAGVLRRLIDDPQSFSAVARRALEICHFDPSTGNDQRRAPRSREDCEAACYDCLMSYSNQIDHALLDRHSVKDILLNLARTRVEASPTGTPRAEHLAELLRLCGSDLERRWLRFLESRTLRLPSKAQVLIEVCQSRPDFLYESHQAAVYIDGPPHEYPERQARDQAQSDAMEDLGYTVIRITHEEDWTAKVKQYPHIFGDRA
jgi:very-short-patch-repair endonuclease